MIRPIRQTHLFQQCSAGCFDGCVAFAAMLFCQQFAGQRDILQGGVLWKEIEVLEYQPEVEPLGADVPLILGGLSSALKIVVPATEIEPPSGFPKS